MKYFIIRITYVLEYSQLRYTIKMYLFIKFNNIGTNKSY